MTNESVGTWRTIKLGGNHNMIEDELLGGGLCSLNTFSSIYLNRDSTVKYSIQEKYIIQVVVMFHLSYVGF